LTAKNLANLAKNTAVHHLLRNSNLEWWRIWVYLPKSQFRRGWEYLSERNWSFAITFWERISSMKRDVKRRKLQSRPVMHQYKRPDAI
jgi:hypothetical protein